MKFPAQFGIAVGGWLCAAGVALGFVSVLWAFALGLTVGWLILEAAAWR